MAAAAPPMAAAAAPMAAAAAPMAAAPPPMAAAAAAPRDAALMAAIREGKPLKRQLRPMAADPPRDDCENVNRIKPSCTSEYTDCPWVGQEKPCVHKNYAASSEECLTNPNDFEKKLGDRINAYRQDKFARQTRSNQQRCESTRGCQWTGKKCSNKNKKQNIWDQFGDVLVDRRLWVNNDDDEQTTDDSESDSSDWSEEGE